MDENRDVTTSRSRQQTEEEKQFWRSVAERRKATALRLGRWSVEMDEKAIVSCHEIFTSWIAAFGKERAIDFLVEALVEEHFLLLDRLEYAKKKKARKRGQRQP